jgi:hypothetical protein
MDTTLAIALAILLATLGMIAIGSLRFPGTRPAPMRTLYLLLGSLMAGSLDALDPISSLTGSMLLGASLVSVALDFRGDLNQWRRTRVLPRP